MAVKANRMHSKGLDGRPQFFFGIFDVGIWITQKWFAIGHENRLNGVYALFGARLTLKMGRTGRDGQPTAQTRS
ncbi:hypothetical protein EJD97_001524 [Solanum chilense]|uniref:Uncharacterized protein n=1 Tax=Solanum chilense TaxID=4083 RepID=A0A6N2AP22_SOLCI|nr:hypothetical protein EJD97_001524 [Solanum chilense]